MFCIRCGKQLPDGSNFCSGCGMQLGNNIPYVQNQPMTPKTMVKNSGLDAICFITLIIFEFVGIVNIVGTFVSFLVTAIWYIIYDRKINNLSNDPSLDLSNLRKTKITLLIWMILNIPIVVSVRFI